MNYKEGDLIFLTGTSWLAKAIQFFTKSKWNHVGVIGKVGIDKVLIYEALKDGFVKGDYEIWWLNAQKENGKVGHRRSKIKLKDVQVTCEKYLGNGYGFLDIWNILIYTIFKKKSFTFNPGSKRLICSEAVARVLYDSSNKQIDFVKEFGKPYDMITPADLSVSIQLKDVYNDN